MEVDFFLGSKSLKSIVCRDDFPLSNLLLEIKEPLSTRKGFISEPFIRTPISLELIWSPNTGKDFVRKDVVGIVFCFNPRNPIQEMTVFANSNTAGKGNFLAEFRKNCLPTISNNPSYWVIFRANVNESDRLNAFLSWNIVESVSTIHESKANPRIMGNLQNISVVFKRVYNVIALQGVSFAFPSTNEDNHPPKLKGMKSLSNLTSSTSSTSSSTKTSSITSSFAPLPSPIPPIFMGNREKRKLEDIYGIPTDFLDSITCEIMENPVILPSGHILDYSTVVKHLEVADTNPFTRLQMTLDQITPALDLKRRIDSFLITRKQEK